MKQKTLKGSFSLFGKGLHTGLNLTVTFNPAPENTGYKIQRIDLEGEPVIDAIAENVVDTQRGTVLGKGDAKCSTVEHGLSALYALGIDNCLIQVNGPEFPILDGSAIKYVEKIREIGIEEQNAPKDYYVIRKKIEVKDDNTGSCITILPDEEFSITAMCSFESKFISSQFATLDDPKKYADEIEELKATYDSKEIAVRKLIEQRFEPPQITYERFMTIIDKSHDLFYHEAESALNITRLAVEDTPRVENEIQNKINTLKSIIDQIEDLTNELVINISSDDKSNEDVKNLVDDMENLIDSVKDYK